MFVLLSSILGISDSFLSLLVLHPCSYLIVPASSAGALFVTRLSAAVNRPAIGLLCLYRSLLYAVFYSSPRFPSVYLGFYGMIPSTTASASWHV
ncbi:hypothetical protein BO70DRAFT_394084 [Aspergillus heteromorphus CBS 117.55]|uniref:Uncharacterized protein n=1 Tax=Aspergillus heteromorphus CBS 117.55 TaxID=1448321 RepID=A0A317WSV5_9EURO|nr:uncharacterized protein BO70DRAFT_394084 [Aspergillus heteromorphus CBS 117.55]PWY88372.1 hypothetical protein BO70DRAFT_394084 [Aspergillus heteromorphus CBS 117.55]